jgi:hypothetical protein
MNLDVKERKANLRGSQAIPTQSQEPTSVTALGTSATSATSAKSGMSRRGFLEHLGLVAATGFVVADGLLAYRAYDQGVLAEGRGPAFRALENWKSYSGPQALVAAAVLAASAHNTQPWLFGLFDDHIDFFADDRRTTGANDPLQREFFVSLGCALENLVLAAGANGYATDITLAQRNAEGLVASIGIRPAPVVVSDLYREIGNRRSNRSKYRDTPVSPEISEAMSSLVDDTVGPARLVWLTTEAEKRKFSALIVEATKAHNADDEQSRASFAWWRNDWDDIRRHKDGLNIDGTGLSPIVRTLGKILPGTTRTSADQTFLDRTRIQAESAAAFGIVLVDDPYSLKDQLAGGRLLQRLHLWASKNTIGFQHMNQITERIDRETDLGRKSRFAGPLAKLVGPGALASFRIGTPTQPALPSPRRSVSEVLR